MRNDFFEKSRRMKGFTLAEVLITLSILGVIAAISISNIHQNFQTRATVTKLRQIYADIDRAFSQAVLEHGSISNWFITYPGRPDTTDGSKSTTNIYNIMKSYFKVKEECTQNSGNCFSPLSEIKNRVGGDTHFSLNPTSYGNDKMFALNNGMSIWIHAHDKQRCLDGAYCFAMFVDVNGPKAPNRFGVDFFTINAFNGTDGKADFLKPECIKKNCNQGDKSAPQAGKGCECWIIYKGNMDYLKRDVSEKW